MNVAGLRSVELEKVFPTAPRIVLFKTQTKSYVFDVNTYQILSCSPVFEQILPALGTEALQEALLEAVEKFGEQEVELAIANIIRLRLDSNPPLLTSNTPANLRIETDFEQYVKKASTELRQMCVCLTSVCDNACRYCSYHGPEYSSEDRAKGVMSLETLNGAIDYFLKYSSNSKQCSLTFYGGEPTLQMPLIKAAVERVSKEREDDACLYGVTTNFVNVTEEMLRYFVANNFILSISLDGPKEVTDRYRIDRNGAPTFDRIMKNLDLLRQIDAKYLDTRVIFLTTVAPPMDFPALKRFFVDDPNTPKPFAHQINMAKLPALEFWKAKCATEGLEGYFELKNEFAKYAIQGVYDDDARSSQISPDPDFVPNAAFAKFLNEMFRMHFLFLYRRSKLNMTAEDTLCVRPGCLPGQHKLFVRYDGVFLPCEKTHEIEPFFIGNCQSGIDFEKAYKLLVDFYELNKSDCLDCWAYNLCNELCYVQMHDPIEQIPSSAIKRERCRQFREGLKIKLVDMMEILERNPQALTFLNGISFT